MSATLLADIGGTTSRLAVTGPSGRPERVVTIANDSVSGLETAILRCLETWPVRPQAAVLAVAAPVAGEEIRLTNRAWHFRLSDLRTRFGLARIRAINDFEALAWALPRLGPGDARAIGPAIPAGNGPKVVLGPGTGLGVAALLAAGGGTHVVASEGGHVSFGPADAAEEPVFARLRAAWGGPVSAEMVLSGRGLARLHAALDPEAPPAAPEAILAAARAGDPAALRTAAWFVRLLGRFAGDVALVFRATGGVFLAGGVALGLGSLCDDAVFREAFEAHRPHEGLMRAIPTAIITYAEPGLLGCAAIAERLASDA